MGDLLQAAHVQRLVMVATYVRDRALPKEIRIDVMQARLSRSIALACPPLQLHSSAGG